MFPLWVYSSSLCPPRLHKVVNLQKPVFLKMCVCAVFTAAERSVPFYEKSLRAVAALF